MLRDSVVVVVMHTCPRAMLLTMIIMRKSTHGFPFLFFKSMRLRLVALRALELRYKENKYIMLTFY